VGAGVAVTLPLTVIAGDDIGREVIPLAVQCLRAVRPDLVPYDGEAGDGEAQRTGFPISEATARLCVETEAVLMGPERPPHEGLPRALDVLTEILDLHCALYPIPLNGDHTLIAAEHLAGNFPPNTSGKRLTPDQNWSATRLGNLARELVEQHGFNRVALAHDSEEEFTFAVMGGFGDDMPIERVDAVYLVNDFGEMAREYPLVLMSARTATRFIPLVLRQSGALTSAARLLQGTRGMVATPVHGALKQLVEWGFANPLGAIHAGLALLRYGLQDEKGAVRLESAIRRATARRRPPDLGGLHTMYEVVWAILGEIDQV
jgi:hypothetical protein